VHLTKYSHSCVRIEDGGRALVIDPGVFSEAGAALAGADAVLITHEHPDHLDEPALRAAAAAHPGLRIWAPAAVAATLADLGDQVTSVGGGEQFEAAGYAIRTFGGQHALIHPLMPIVANVGYLVDGSLYHPGDSLIVPSVPVTTLLVPTHAPWSKTAEVIDFIVSVRAPQAFQIHDALLNENGTGLVERLITTLAAPHGTTFEHLAPSSVVTL
jgi:glyoxylase-like metal-dependent hydrolase (beta-lactamase superfamily II)